jgi:hypothetical protein
MTSRNASRLTRQWPAILDDARTILETSADRMTLRQLFYRLAAAGIIRNSENDYKTLSDRTAVARRAGTFPVLVDRTRRTGAPLTEAARAGHHARHLRP